MPLETINSVRRPTQDGAAWTGLTPGKQEASEGRICSTGRRHEFPYCFPRLGVQGATTVRHKAYEYGLIKGKFRDVGREIRSKHAAVSGHDIVTTKLIKRL